MSEFKEKKEKEERFVSLNMRLSDKGLLFSLKNRVNYILIIIK